MNSYIDIYCERLDPGFWAEPLNALTNLSFILAAFFAWRLVQQKGPAGWREYALVGLIAIIGLGSFLFHTFAAVWAQLVDVLPILFFQIVFIMVYAERVMRLNCNVKHAMLVVFLVFIYGFGQLPSEWLNGSLGYAPAFIFLIGLGLWHYFKAAREKTILLGAATIFAASLTFRSIDMELCADFPLGTHFMWHTLNGAVLYLTARSYLVNRP